MFAKHARNLKAGAGSSPASSATLFLDLSAGPFCYVYIHFMSDLLNKQIVLKLNKLWWALEFITVKNAFSEICSINPQTGQPPQLPLDLSYEINPDGSYNTDVLLGSRPVTIDEWMELPVRSCDLGIQCARRLIRVPTITICSNFADIPDMRPKFSPQAIRERDNHTCQVTKRKLAPGEGDMAHDLAKAKGGKRTWENIAYVRKDLNRLQGTRSFKEMGWDIKPKVPKSRRVLLTQADLKHESQKNFLHPV